jgi:RNA polymerase sigma-70 factor (ECF subfamily)
MAVTDGELVEQAITGSQSAYAELARRYAGAAVNLAARMVQDRALAEDLAQEAFARAFARLGSYDRQHSFSSWFFQILHNVAVDYLRRKRVRTTSLDEMESAGMPLTPVAREPLPDAQAEHAALGLALEEAMARLRPDYREAVVLRYRENVPVQEIAQIMDIPVGTVKTYLFRARKELAAMLGPQGWGERAAPGVETPRRTNP